MNPFKSFLARRRQRAEQAAANLKAEQEKLDKEQMEELRVAYARCRDDLAAHGIVPINGRSYHVHELVYMNGLKTIVRSTTQFIAPFGIVSWTYDFTNKTHSFKNP